MKKLTVLVLALLLLCGCGEAEKAPVQVDVNALYTTLAAEGMPEMVELGADMQLNLYGIRAEDVKQAKVAVAADGLRADELWLIEAVDAAAAEKLLGLAQNRINQKDAESITYSPEQNKVVKASWVSVQGNYLFLITSPNVDAMRGQVQKALGQ